MNKLYFRPEFLLNSIEAWEEDVKKRFNLAELNDSFHEAVPVLDFLDWKITSVKRGYAETLLPLNSSSSNQYVTHQAALMLLAADYTGGLAIATLFHLLPVVGFWPVTGDYGIYMWGAKADIKWYAPSCHDLVCQAKIDKTEWPLITKRLLNNKKVVTTVTVNMFNGEQKVAETKFTYWVQDIENMRKNAFDSKKIELLYEHKTKTTARSYSL